MKRKWTAEEIKELRTRLDLNQVDFAARLGIAVATVSRWEQGRKSPIGHLALALDKLDKEHPR